MTMSEEELKAICNDIYEGGEWNYIIKYVLDLQDKIEKQQKEIEELKKPKYIVSFKNNEIEKITELKNDFISKDKIREEIKEYENELEHIKNGEEFENEEPMYYWGKRALERLLEEEAKD